MPMYRKIDKDFFKKWTPEMAYVLGFFAADGYMTENKRGAFFWNIQINDLDLLLSIKRLLKSDHKISMKTKNRSEKISYRLQIGSKEMYDDLYNLGMRQNKSKSLTVPKVPDKFFGDFIRGYFDGDGNVWVGDTHRKRKNSSLTIRTVFTSCSQRFLNAIKEKLEENSVKKGVLRKGKGNFYTLTYSVFGSLNLYAFMYNGMCLSRLSLNRKKAIFDRYIEMRA